MMRDYEFDNFTPTQTVGSFVREPDRDFKDSLVAALESVEASLQINPIDEPAKVLGTRAYKEQYKAALLESYSNEVNVNPYYSLHADKLDQLFENSTYQMLRESAVAPLSPIVGLTLPVLKKSYIESVSKDIVMTEVTPQPVIKKSFERKFIKDKQANKHYVPEIFYNGEWEKVVDKGLGKPVTDNEVTVPQNDYDLLGQSGGSLEARDTLSMDVHVKTVKMTVKDSAGTGTTDKEFPVHLIARIDNEKIAHFEVTGYGEDSDKTPEKDTLILIVDWYTGRVKISSTNGKIKAVKFGGHLSNQNNTQVLEIDKERTVFTWNVKEGVRINTGVTIEKIKDYRSMMDQDYVAEAVADMSTMISQFEDSDILKQLDASFDKWKDLKDLPLGYELPFVKEIPFDCTPQSAQLHTTREYLKEELPYTIQTFINELKNVLKETELMFVMHGHPENIQLALADIDWVIDNDAKLGGVTLGYKFGITTNNGTPIHVVSSLKESKEKGIRLTAHALNDNVFTCKNWKYSFNIENTYQNPYTPLTPNLMGTSKYTYAELTPVQGGVKLKNHKYGVGSR